MLAIDRTGEGRFRLILWIILRRILFSSNGMHLYIHVIHWNTLLCVDIMQKSRFFFNCNKYFWKYEKIAGIIYKNHIFCFQLIWFHQKYYLIVFTGYANILYPHVRPLICPNPAHKYVYVHIHIQTISIFLTCVRVQ